MTNRTSRVAIALYSAAVAIFAGTVIGCGNAAAPPKESKPVSNEAPESTHKAAQDSSPAKPDEDKGGPILTPPDTLSPDGSEK